MANNRRCAYLTMEDLTGFYSYDSLTYQPLQELGWTVEEIPWNRPDVDWRQYAAVVIRSTWDYQKQPQAFLETLEIIEVNGTPLFNSLEYCRWNMDKRYLKDLERKGVVILPTIWGDSMELSGFDLWTKELNAERVVIKPTVGANADDTFVLSADDSSGLETVSRIFQNKSFMVQPFVESIQTLGEFSLFYFGGDFSHAINKLPKRGDFRVQEEHGGVIQAISANEELKSAGQYVIDQLGQKLLYARVDFVDWGGKPTLMEVELIEPSLYFAYDNNAAKMFARELDRMMRPSIMPGKNVRPRI